jgi:hypothetical protein
VKNNISAQQFNGIDLGHRGVSFSKSKSVA